MRWFRRVNVKVNDGDGRIEAAVEPLKSRLQVAVEQGIDMHIIQIFHYASVKYVTRWKSLTARFINAFMDGGAMTSALNGKLTLSGDENHELQGDTSEVLGVGLSCLFMCKWFDININRIEQIGTTTKRCDFRFTHDNKTIIFESKGRSYRNKIAEAFRDALVKKQQHVADEKYALISFLPRDNSPVELFIYDPPTETGDIQNNLYYVLAKHYRGVTLLSGLNILSAAIDKRIHQYEQKGTWEEEQIKLDENVVKIGWNIYIGKETYWTRRQPTEIQIGNSIYYIHFGLNTKIMNLLRNWNMDELASINVNAQVDKEKSISILQDGSLLYISDKRLETHKNILQENSSC